MIKKWHWSPTSCNCRCRWAHWRLFCFKERLIVRSVFTPKFLLKLLFWLWYECFWSTCWSQTNWLLMIHCAFCWCFGLYQLWNTKYDPSFIRLPSLSTATCWLHSSNSVTALWVVSSNCLVNKVWTLSALTWNRSWAPSTQSGFQLITWRNLEASTLQCVLANGA